MTILKIGGRLVKNKGQIIKFFIPSETPALNRLQNFWTATNIFAVDWNRLAVNQTELESYMNFDSTEYYNFSYTFVHSGLSYFQATATHQAIHSYTTTTIWPNLERITCKRLGLVAPGPANYDGNVLSCPLNSQEHS